MCADKYSPALSIRTAAGDRSIEDGSIIVLNALQLIREDGLFLCVQFSGYFCSFKDIILSQIFV